MKTAAVTILLMALCCGFSTSAESPRLESWYKSDNVAYFGGKLPTDTIVRYGSLGDNLGLTTKIDGVFVITIDPKWAPAPVTQQETLLHEECHVETWDELVSHGPRWQACMHLLYMNHAFDGLL